MRTLVMGILNVTPDSFSDGGEHQTPEDALAHARHMLSEGADLIDVGGESTRPGSVRPEVEEELARVVPVVEKLAGAGVIVSVDTMRAEVARACLDRGAAIINDVSAGLADPDMLATVAESGADYVAMHWRGHGDVMDHRAHYEDVTAEVKAELGQRIEAARAAGIASERIIIDPGYGFAKDAEQNWELLARQQEFVDLGYRVLVGVSRKRFLGDLLRTDLGPRPVTRRDDASAAITTYSAMQGVWAVRTHTVRQHRDAVEVMDRLRAAVGSR
ncbi:dihydropteroate synthase [Aestuariimicrobium sp. p3-SID1156]|uniref:dihydropteroate synthase n=1 Tax=Aestuariimicrobium sp. p3-SID1156 TaxID=2916038 RepID=UPI00223BAB1D|nr:dihydropteroate synthase [Aestuariimicrobium sp. p3-SID1156]MCT1458596.1 dihydropteroate synthase [Aestuariimicrobium sp. p3-SID1156]